MTNEEAINILRGIRLENLNLDDAYTKDRYDALVMAIEALERSEKFQRKAEVVISQLRADRDRLADAIEKIRAEIIENSIEDYKYHGCGSDELIIDTSLVLEIIDKHTKEREEE